MRKIIMLGCVSFALVCAAADADARSSDEEDTPQTASAMIAASPRTLSPASINLHAERKPGAGARRPAAAPMQEDDHVQY